MTDLFPDDEPWVEPVTPGAVILRRFARGCARELLAGIDAVAARAPFRQMQTPGGFTMSVAMTSCGAQGWVTDRQGYRYQPRDPQDLQPWPPMPPAFLTLGQQAAESAGFPGFMPDSCLINRYLPGARMALHQDKDERDLRAPIVSVSLGLTARFLFGGLSRRDPVRQIPLEHGDVVVWGGPARLAYHGIMPVRPGEHPLVGGVRYNLTLRQSGKNE